MKRKEKQWRTKKELGADGRPPHGGIVCASLPQLHLTRAAEMVGVSAAHLSRILSGKRKPSLKVAVKVAEVLGMKIEVVAAFGCKGGVIQRKRRRES